MEEAHLDGRGLAPSTRRSRLGRRRARELVVFVVVRELEVDAGALGGRLLDLGAAARRRRRRFGCGLGLRALGRARGEERVSGRFPPACAGRSAPSAQAAQP